MIEYGLTMGIYNLLIGWWWPQPSARTKLQLKRAALLGGYGILLLATRSR